MADLRGHRRDPAPRDRAQPAERPRGCRWAPGMTARAGSDALTLSLVSIPGEAAVRYPQRVAVVDREREYTYADIWREILIRARALRDEHGVEPGTHVALMAPNGLNFVAEYYAILACGGVVVPMAPMLVTDEVETEL